MIFVRSKKLPQWVPLSVVKGGTAANMLVKGLETELMRDVTLKTLVEVRRRAVGRVCGGGQGLRGWEAGSGGGACRGGRRWRVVRLWEGDCGAAPHLASVPPPSHCHHCHRHPPCNQVEHRQGSVQGQGRNHLGRAVCLPALQGGHRVCVWLQDPVRLAGRCFLCSRSIRCTHFNVADPKRLLAATTLPHSAAFSRCLPPPL